MFGVYGCPLVCQHLQDKAAWRPPCTCASAQEVRNTVRSFGKASQEANDPAPVPGIGADARLPPAVIIWKNYTEKRGKERASEEKTKEEEGEGRKIF
ncbi:uncharacterized [Tachysurus ichikawai]